MNKFSKMKVHWRT